MAISRARRILGKAREGLAGQDPADTASQVRMARDNLVNPPLSRGRTVRALLVRGRDRKRTSPARLVAPTASRSTGNPSTASRPVSRSTAGRASRNTAGRASRNTAASQPGGPPQPWASHQPANDRGKGKLIALIAGGAGLLVVIGVLLYFFVFSGGSGPEAAVRSFYSAAKAGNCDEMWNLIDKPSSLPVDEQKGKELFCRGVTEQSSAIPELEGTKLIEEKGDSAKVEVTSKSKDGQSETETMTLTKVGGAWKISLNGSGSGSGG